MNFHYFASVFTTFLDGNVKLWNLLGIKESFKSLNFEKNEYMCFIQPRILKEIISHISLLVYALCIAYLRGWIYQHQSCINYQEKHFCWHYSLFEIWLSRDTILFLDLCPSQVDTVLVTFSTSYQSPLSYSLMYVLLQWEMAWRVLGLLQLKRYGTVLLQ